MYTLLFNNKISSQQYTQKRNEKVALKRTRFLKKKKKDNDLRGTAAISHWEECCAGMNKDSCSLSKRCM